MTAVTEAAELHRLSLVVDTMGPPGPSVFTDAMLARLDAMAADGAEPAAAIDAMDLGADEAVLSGELSERFWARWDVSGVDVSSYTIGGFGTPMWTYENAIRDIARWTRKFDELDGFLKVTTADDMLDAHRTGRKGIVLNFQNTAHFGEDLTRLERFHQLGVRIIQLTYNSKNLVGDGCTERNPGGLSRFGLDVVAAMNELGVLVDVSHCSHRTAMDAAEASTRPIAITHGFAEAVNQHDRGASDELLRAIGEQDGYVGIVTVPFFLSADPDVTLDHLLRHVDHVASVAGIDKVGIGTDWAPPIPPRLQEMLTVQLEHLKFRPEHRVDWGATVKDLDTWEDWPNITAALLEHGYAPDEVRGVIGGNFQRVFRRAVG